MLLAELESVDTRRRAPRGALRGDELAAGAPVGHPLPARLGDAFPAREGSTTLVRHSARRGAGRRWPPGTCRSRARRSSAGSPATRRRRHDCRRSRTTSPQRSAASSWCRRRRWRSSTPWRRPSEGRCTRPCSNASTTSGGAGRAAECSRALGPRVGRVLGGALGARRRARRPRHEIAIQYGLEVPQDHLPIAVDRRASRRARARPRALRASPGARRAAVRLHPPQHLAMLGLVALWSGTRPTRRRRLARGRPAAARLGWGEPSIRWWTPDHVELLARAGRDRRRRPSCSTSGRRTRPRRTRVGARTRDALPRTRRSRPRGRREATGLLRRAVAEHEAVGDPFGRARALARARHRPAARPAEAGSARCDRAGSRRLRAARRRTWVERARAELGRIGGRTRAAGPDSGRAAGRRTGRRGRTNREVAAALFLAERTVASHLTHIYAKLGVRSRTELARTLN